LLLALFLGTLAEKRVVDCTESSEPRAIEEQAKEEAKAKQQPIGQGQGGRARGGYRMVLGDRYLLLIGLLMLLLNFASSTGDFLLSSLVKERAEQAQVADVTTFIGEFYSDFYFWVNLVGVVVQLFVTSRLMQHFGVRVALLVLPALALGANLAIAVMPILFVVRWTKMTQNALDYSLNNTVRNALFLPRGAEEKDKSKH